MVCHKKILFHNTLPKYTGSITKYTIYFNIITVDMVTFLRKLTNRKETMMRTIPIFADISLHYQY